MFLAKNWTLEVLSPITANCDYYFSTRVSGCVWWYFFQKRNSMYTLKEVQWGYFFYSSGGVNKSVLIQWKTRWPGKILKTSNRVLSLSRPASNVMLRVRESICTCRRTFTPIARVPTWFLIFLSYGTQSEKLCNTTLRVSSRNESTTTTVAAVAMS